MGIPRIVLRKEDIKSNGECLLYIRYIHKGKIKFFSTGTTVDKNDLIYQQGIIGKQKINQLNFLSKKATGYSWAKSRVERKLDAVKSIIKNIEDNGKEPTTSLVSELFKNQNQELSKANDSVYDIFNQYLAESSTTKTVSTIKQYKSSLQHLKNFFQNQQITLDNLDNSFYKNYLRYLIDDLELSNNTVGNQIKNLKTFLNWVKEKGYTIQINTKKLKVFKENPLIVYLTQDELIKIEAYLLEHKSRLDKVRDLLVFSCHTGLRKSDINRLGQEHISDGAISMKAHKNKNPIYVPLTRIAKTILEKWNYVLPIISDQKYNEYLKELCELIGIDDEIEEVIYSGGSKKYNKILKYDKISSHIGSKTFITHCGEKGISAKTVSEITGKSVKTILDHYYGTNHKMIKSEIENAFS